MSGSCVRTAFSIRFRVAAGGDFLRIRNVSGLHDTRIACQKWCNSSLVNSTIRSISYLMTTPGSSVLRHGALLSVSMRGNKSAPAPDETRTPRKGCSRASSASPDLSATYFTHQQQRGLRSLQFADQVIGKQKRRKILRIAGFGQSTPPAASGNAGEVSTGESICGVFCVTC